MCLSILTWCCLSDYPPFAEAALTASAVFEAGGGVTGLLMLAFPTSACKMSSILSNLVSRCDIFVSIVIEETTVVVSVSGVAGVLIVALAFVCRCGVAVPNVDTDVVSNWGTNVSEAGTEVGRSFVLVRSEMSTYSKVSLSCYISSSSRSSFDRGLPVSGSQVTSLITCCVSTGSDESIASPYSLCKYAPRLAILSFAVCSYFFGYIIAKEERVQLRSTLMK